MSAVGFLGAQLCEGLSNSSPFRREVAKAIAEALRVPALSSVPLSLVHCDGTWWLTNGDDFALLFLERNENIASELCMFFSNAVLKRQDGRFCTAGAFSL